MADQDHGLDEVRELARGLRENEHPGETREGVRVVLAICTNCGKPLSPESVESGWCHCEPDDFDDLKRTYEAVPYVPASLLTDLARKLEARAGIWEETGQHPQADQRFTAKAEAFRESAQLLLSLIEHGPDDGLSGGPLTEEGMRRAVEELYKPPKPRPVHGEPDDGEPEPKRCTCEYLLQAPGMMYGPDCPVHGNR